MTSLVTKTSSAGPWWYGGLARFISLMMAALVSLILTLYPQLIMHDAKLVSHNALMLCLWGTAAGFVHGVGFVPMHWVFRYALGPWAAWSLTPSSLLLLTGVA